MAVYKTTYCYPMLNSLDIRVTETASNPTPYEWFKCKIDSSNKKITGYKIRVLDSSNNQIFPDPKNNKEGRISPINELAKLTVDGDKYANTGMNGTFLYMPFFQTYSTKIPTDGEMPRFNFSFNAVYYRPRFSATYVLGESDSSIFDWSYDATTDSLSNSSWDGTFNGETASVGETILILASANSEYCGIWRVNARGLLIREKDIYGNGIDSTMLDEEYVVILHGSYHNNVYKLENNEFALVDQHVTPMWVDIFGNALDFSIESGSYKWEITLYQGDPGSVGYKTQNIRVDGVNRPVPYMDYTKLSNEWLDMVLTTGQIMGSTNKRIQIANKLTGDDIKLPEGSVNDPLVLQGRFVQLLGRVGNSNNFTNVGKRAYIQTYDATYGHIYPIADSFDLTTINSENVQKVAVYKHSNNVEDILDNEIVKCATTGNLPGLYETEISGDKESIDLYYNGSLGEYDNIIDDVIIVTGMKVLNKNGSTWTIQRAASVNSQEGTVNWDNLGTWTSSTIYEIKRGVEYIGALFQGTSGVPLNSSGTGLPVIDGYSVREGDLVLVKNQTKAYENGVYIAHDVGPYPYSPVRWERSGSYDQWGNFIGAIIFVVNGAQNGGKNFESLAGVGGELYSSTNVSSGNTPLYFKEEKPMILFSHDSMREIDVYTGNTITHDSEVGQNAKYIDGVSAFEGMKVLRNVSGTNKMEILRITSVSYQSFRGFIDNVDNNMQDSSSKNIQVVETNATSPQPTTERVSIDWEVEEVIDCSNNNTAYFYILTGQTYGHNIISKTNSSVNTNNTEWLSAWILKNTKTYTYVSPYSGLDTLMKLHFLNHKEAELADGELTPWLAITGVNKTVWRINHAELKSPLVSADAYDESIPFKYELRSFFKKGDENPFTTNEAPYLKLTDASTGYSNILIHDNYNVLTSDLSDEEEFMVKESSYTTVREPYLILSSYLSAIAARQVTLQGTYIQFQQASWESYRWVLTDYYGNILQDTGKRYDKEMKVTFYGLSNETDNFNNRYNAILYVEDTLGLTTEYAIRLVVDPQSQVSLYIPFTAEFECDLHAVKLTYADNAYVYPSISLGNKDLVYTADNAKAITGWDNSISYKDSKLYVTGPQGNNVITIVNPYATSGDYSGLSYTETHGVNYAHYFGVDNMSVDPNLQYLFIEDNECTIDTIIELSKSYCGNFFEFTVEDAADAAKLSLILRVPDTFIGGYSEDDLNPDRNTYEFFVKKTQSGDLDYYTTPQKIMHAVNNGLRELTRYSTDLPLYYYFQRADLPEASGAEYQNMTLIENHTTWYHKGDKNNPYLNSPKIYGNLGLVNKLDLQDIGESIDPLGSVYKNTAHRCNGAPGYWVESRCRLKPYNGPALQDYNESNLQDSGISLCRCDEDGNPITGDDESGLLYWPSANETDNYWMELNPDDYGSGYVNPAQIYPAYWTSINTKVGSIIPFTGHERHPSVMNSKLHIVIRLHDVASMFLEAQDPTFTATLVWDNTAVDDEAYTATINIGTTEVGTMMIKPVVS